MMKLRKIKIQKKRKPMFQKRSQFQSVLLAIIMMVIIAIVIVFFNRVNHELYSSLDEYFNNSDTQYNESIRVTQRLISIEESQIWDFAFLAIFFGLMLNMLVFSFATRISSAFYWLFAILGMFIFIAGIVLSSVWVEISENPVFVDTITRFPMTNAMLGSKFPTIMTGIIMITMIVLFGKRPFQGGDL